MAAAVSVAALVVSGPTVPGFEDGVVRAGLLILFGAGALGAGAGSLSGSGVWVREIGGMASGALIGAWFTSELATAGLLLLAWGVPWACGLPLRGLGSVGGGRLVTLVTAACLYGTPWFVPRRWSDLPSWVLEWNPLVRLHGSLHGEDWFHGPTLYPRVGERFYVYPEPEAGFMAPLAVIVGGVVAALGLRLLRKRYAALPARQG